MHIDDAAVARLLPDFELGGEIGRGQFGVVWSARHRHLGRRVAVKQLTGMGTRDGEENARRFRREARILAGLDHPHVVTVFDYREEGELRLIVLEHLDGGTLGERRGLIGPTGCVAALIAAASGLHHAHESGVLHRDVKPENLMFDHRQVLKVTDFGVARGDAGDLGSVTVTDVELSRVGQFFGTPAYVSPEQAAAAMAGTRAEIGPAADLYGLAAVGFELLTGELTHDAEGGLIGLCHRRMSEPAPPLRSLAPDVDGGIAEVLDRALARDPSDRHETLEAFGVALARAGTSAFGPGWIEGAGVVLRDTGPIRRSLDATPVEGWGRPGRGSRFADTTRPSDPALGHSGETTSAAPLPDPPGGRTAGPGDRQHRPGAGRTDRPSGGRPARLRDPQADPRRPEAPPGAGTPTPTGGSPERPGGQHDGRGGGRTPAAGPPVEGSGPEAPSRVVGSLSQPRRGAPGPAGPIPGDPSDPARAPGAHEPVVARSTPPGHTLPGSSPRPTVPAVSVHTAGGPSLGEGPVPVPVTAPLTVGGAKRSRRWTAIAIAAALLAVAAGVVLVLGDDDTDGDSGAEPEPQTSMTLAWSVSIGGDVFSSPVVDGDRVVVGSDAGAVTVRSAGDGSEVWSRRVTSGEPVRASVAVAGERYLVAGFDGRVRALARSDGAEDWVQDLGFEVVATPAVGGDTVVVGTDALHGRALADGSPLWEYRSPAPSACRDDLGAVFVATPVVFDTTVVAVSTEGTVHAVDLGTGEAIWTNEEPGCGLVARPHVGADGITVGDGDGVLWTFSLADGSVVRRVELGDPVRAAVAVDGDMMVAGTGGGLVGLDTDGEVRWATDLPDPVDSSPVFVDGLVVAGCTDGRVYALEASTGEIVSSFPTGGEVLSSPAVLDDDTVVVGSSDDVLRALTDLRG